jgi:UDP-glucose 4-epimerase
MNIPFAQLARVYVSDVVRALELALDAPHTPGARVFNIVGPDASCDVPTADMLRAVLGERADALDLSYYAQPGNERKPVYAMERMRDAFGFVPQRSTRKD